MPSNFRNAFPRWLCWFFSSRGSSANVFFSDREVKHRIVPKSAAPSRRFQYLSIHACRHNRHCLPAFRQSNRAHKISRPFRTFLSAKFTKQFPNTLRIRGVSPRIARRTNSGRSPERGHDQPGIVRKHESFREAANNAAPFPRHFPQMLARPLRTTA